MDVLTRVQRHLNMSRIRGRDTKLELLLRRGLHARGLRFRVQRRDLPGRPDVVLPKYRVCVFVHGCFWHGHGCELFRMPGTRQDFWRRKISGTRERDKRSVDALLRAGWRILVVWECAVRGPRRLSREAVLEESFQFIVGSRGCGDESGSLKEIDGSRQGPPADRRHVEHQEDYSDGQGLSLKSRSRTASRGRQ